MARKKYDRQTGGRPVVGDAIAAMKYPANRKNIPPAGLEAEGALRKRPNPPRGQSWQPS